MARLQARLGAARLGATRLGDFKPSVTLHINSTQAWRPGGPQGILVDPSLAVQEAIEDVPRTAHFELRDVTSPPQPGQAVYIGLGSASNRLFAGNILHVQQSQSRYADQPVWAVECEDNQRLLNRRLVTARFQSTDAADIIRTIVTSYTSGFTVNHVKGTFGTIDEVEFTAERVSKALTRVCQRIGARWYLDPWNDVHAFTGEEAGVSPAAALTATGKQMQWRHRRDLSQVRTRVFVKGGGHGTSQAHILGTTLVFLDDTEYLTGVTTIAAGRHYYDVASVNRIAAPWFVVLSNSLSVGGLREGLPTGTSFNVFAIAESTTLQSAIAAVEGGDGIHEYYVADGRLTQGGALSRARAELTLYGQPEQAGTYTTRDPSAVAGRQLIANVTSPTHITSVTTRIQRVTVTDFEDSRGPWSSTRTSLFPKRKVTYSSVAVRDVYQILGDYERDRR